MMRVMISPIPCTNCGCDEVYFHHDNDLWQCVKCDYTVPYEDKNDAAEKTSPAETLVYA